MYPKNFLLANKISGPAGIRTRVRGSGGPDNIHAIPQVHWKTEFTRNGKRFMPVDEPGDPVSPFERVGTE